MSVIIKDCDKPKRCVVCFAFWAGMCQLKQDQGRCPFDGVPEWCPIEKDAPKWIPVSSEVFPKNGQRVLISIDNVKEPILGRYEEDEDGGLFYEDGGLFYVHGVNCLLQNYFVNAWMPLPEPYKEDLDG